MIRLLTLYDLEEFRALRLHSLREEPEAFLWLYEEMKDKPSGFFKQYFEGSRLAGGFVDGRLVSIAGLHRLEGIKRSHKAELWGVYTMPSARGGGLGKACIELLIEDAKQQGIEMVQLTTNIARPATVAFYENLGFVSYGIDKHILKLPDGSYVDDVMMVKSLI